MMEWSTSGAGFEDACKYIAGGVNSPARAFGAVGGHPILVRRADGPFLIDVDGNKYVDYIGSWGPMILGHCHPEVISAIQTAAESGTSYGAPTLGETEFAKRIHEAMPSIELVRLLSSGTEAAMSAIRLARGFTKRNKILKFAGCYHGHVDSLLVQAGSAATTLGTPSSPGIPAGCTADTIILPFNNHNALADAFEHFGTEIACAIVEPVVGNMGVVVPKEGFLEYLSEMTSAYGAVLIFDEVITGFRVGFGGAQQRFGVRPDLTLLGKIIGGGLPMGAYGGRAEIMNQISPLGPVFQAGTLSGNPLAVAAGIATLTQLRDHAPYEKLEQLSVRLAKGLDAAAERAGIPHTLARVGSMMTLFFHGESVIDYETAKRTDTQRYAKFFWKMMKRGIYLPCSQFEALFVSAAHTEELIDQTIAAADQSLQEIADS